jgi:hypothetical protein
MRFVSTCIAATALLAATTAQAGGLAEEIMEAPVVVEEEMAPAGSSISPAIIVVGILAALLLAANSGDDDEPVSIEESDERLKDDIIRVGTAFNGLPIYSFSYTGRDGTYLGVMAQDVLMHTPEAVRVMDNGYMAVNYGMLGMRMVQLD